MGTPLTPALAALAATCAACATVPPCPAKGGPAWVEVTSAHFRMRTDLDRADAEEAIRLFEEIRASVLATVWPGAPEPPGRTEVIALRSHSELVGFTWRDEFFGARVQAPPFRPVIVTGGLQPRERITLAHELAHELSTWFLPTQPFWFSEGIATFLETLHYDRAQGRAWAGAPSEVRLHDLRAVGIVRANRLLGPARPPDDQMGRFEATAWLLMHYLINRHPKQLAELQMRFSRLEAPDHAWKAVLPALPLDRLDTELWQYVSFGRYTSGYLTLAIPTPLFQVRTMTDAEVHAARPYLYETLPVKIGTQDPAGRSEVEEALATEPANTDALAVELYGLVPPAERGKHTDLAHRAATAHPDQWLAWMMTATTAANDAEKRTALTRALVAGPDVPDVIAELAVLDARQERWEEGAPLSLKAMRLGVRRPDLIWAHMLNLVHTGRCGDARLLLELLTHEADTPQAQNLRATTSEVINRSCGPPS